MIPNMHEDRALEPLISLSQALEAAIELGLPRVEAGAQGEHKISRGYLPSTTYSSHYIADPTFRSAVGHFLDRESMDIEYR